MREHVPLRTRVPLRERASAVVKGTDVSRETSGRPEDHDGWGLMIVS
ncbi:UNVERIFIED_ORG: hypothetical protein QOE_3758 [Clostridioides difficile F501]